jgi:hypothetical protein
VNHRPSLYGPIPLKRSDFAPFRRANKKQPFAKIAIFASKTVKFDEKSDKTDSFGRYLVWIFVDGNLLQEKLVSKGLASVAYLYGDYKYIDKLEKAEQLAEENKLGIWNIDSNEEIEEEIKDNEIDNKVTKKQEKNTSKINSFITKYKDYIILIGALIIVSIFNLKSKKKVTNKLKTKIKKDIKKRLK